MLIKKDRLPVREILIYGFLPSFLKVFIYRMKGYHIGRRVHIGLGAVVIGSSVEIGDGVSIGFFTIIRGKNIRLGDHVVIGATTFLDTPNIAIGEATRINEQVFVGGLQFPDSKFVVGRNCLIQQMSFINPSPSIKIGDDSAIGGHNLIFGHVSWHNCFEGYPVEFSPVEIGTHAGTGWRTFILPGAKIGDGASIGANSVVNREIPPRCLAVGFPVRIVSKEPDFPKRLSDEDRVKMLKRIVAEMLEHFAAADLKIEVSGVNTYVVQYARKKLFFKTTERCQIKVFYETMGEDEVPELNPLGAVVSLKPVPDNVRSRLSSKNVLWMDIENRDRNDLDTPVGDEIFEFMRRYGVRFNRWKE